MAGTIHPVLFVGCGGSGGVTLRYTMDSLRAEVSRVNDARAATEGEDQRLDFGPHGLPKSWQFLHIDVPDAPDGNKPGRPPNVPAQGGTYVSLAPLGFEYRVVSDQLWSRVQSGQAKHLAAGWMKRPDPATDPVLTAGAGQMRNVGRAVALYSLPKLAEGVAQAAQHLVSADAQDDLRRLAALLGSDTSNSPIVIIVSSMSGGAGASMVLDVARVLARLRPTWLGLTSMFLYTSEVFSELPEQSRTGVEGNGLAAAGELLATSLGANGQRIIAAGDDGELRAAAGLEAHNDENRLLADLGFAGGTGAQSQTYRRVFPIGNSQGAGAALFGDGSMDTIYRAIGRGLAGLTGSPTALSEFASYDLTNPNPIGTDLSWLGAGAGSVQSVLWGSFGFARLSLGRDKYAEYLAQRIARDAVDRLAGLSGVREATAERDMAVTADTSYAAMLEELGLPARRAQVGSIALLGRIGGADQVRSDLTNAVRASLTEQVYGHRQVRMADTPGDFHLALTRVTGEVRRSAMDRINETSYAMAHGWTTRFSQDVARSIEAIAARHGIPVARQVVLRLREDSARWSRSLIDEGRALAPDGSTALPPPNPEAMAQLAKLPVLDPNMRAKVLNDHVMLVTRSAGARIAGLLGEALAEFGDRYAAPLARTLQETLVRLESARARVDEGSGVAEVRTSTYAEWPSADGTVATRFHGAHNEVMLIDPTSFPGQAEADIDLIRRARGLNSVGQTREAILREVLTGRWHGHHDDSAQAMTLHPVTEWVPTAMVRDPARTDMGRVATQAKFTFDAEPASVLERSRRWVTRPTGELAPFLRQGLRGYLSEPGGVPNPERLAEFSRRFAVTLQHAAPLMQVDAPAFSVVHPGVKLEQMFKFSGVPLAGLPGRPDMELVNVVANAGTVAEEAVRGFTAALDASTTTEHVDIFGSYAPMSPLAIPSLLKPLASAIARVSSAGTVQTFWRNRRARPLAGCLAMTPVERRSLIAGYVVGRMTGRIRGSYAQNPYEHSEPLAVFGESFGGDGTWFRFPTPLLTPHVTGFDSDEVAALLEAHLVALARCGYDGSLAPMAPYKALRSVYGAPTDREGREYDPSLGAVRYLRGYVLADARVPDGGPRRAEIAVAADGQLGSAQGRKVAALGYLDSLAAGVREAFGGDDPARSPQIDGLRFDTRPLLNSLAPDLLWAVAELRRIVLAIDASEVPDLAGPSGPGSAVRF